jgi:hypothetical protein
MKAYNEFTEEEVKAFGKNKKDYEGPIAEGMAIDGGKVYFKYYEDQENVRVVPYGKTGDFDEKIAKSINRVYVKFNNDDDIEFHGDTYNQKDEIRAFAEKNNVKVAWDKYNKVWKIKTADLSDEDFVNILKAVLENYDYSRHTEDEFKKMIEDYS